MRTDRWLVVTIEVPSADLAGLYAEGIFAFNGQAVEERGSTLITYLPPSEEFPEILVDNLARALSSVHDGALPKMTWAWQEDRDWAEEWKKGLAPRRVGDRLIIAPSWTKPQTGAGDIVITIDPQMAFGTGEHASTRGALRLLEFVSPVGLDVLDVGTGSAVLAISAARLGARAVRAVEADADALINARENVDRNGVADTVSLEQRLADDAFLRTVGPYDLILANILSSVIIPLLPAFLARLRAPGRVIVAGILQAESDAFVAAARRAGFKLLKEDREEEWWGGLLEPFAAAAPANHPGRP
jgi:ribosomal protein L11 methyltransferase